MNKTVYVMTTCVDINKNSSLLIVQGMYNRQVRTNLTKLNCSFWVKRCIDHFSILF